MTDREQLAARIEAADASEQRAMLCAAFQFLRGATASADEFWSDSPRPGTFHAKLNAEAYLDAAMMLVPEGHKHWNLGGSPTQGFAGQGLYGAAINDEYYGEAATPALALAAAAIRSQP